MPIVLVTDTPHEEAERTLQGILEGHRELVPWIWTSVGLTVLAKAAIAIEVGRSRWRAESDVTPVA